MEANRLQAGRPWHVRPTRACRAEDTVSDLVRAVAVSATIDGHNQAMPVGQARSETPQSDGQCHPEGASDADREDQFVLVRPLRAYVGDHVRRYKEMVREVVTPPLDAVMRRLSGAHGIGAVEEQVPDLVCHGEALPGQHVAAPDVDEPTPCVVSAGASRPHWKLQDPETRRPPFTIERRGHLIVYLRLKGQHTPKVGGDLPQGVSRPYLNKAPVDVLTPR
jgi:hypothetical protein